MFKIEVIDRYVHCIMQDLKNAQVCIYSLADLKRDHCVKSTFPEGNLGRFLLLMFQNAVFKLIAF